MITQRDSFWNEIYQQAKTDRDIIIVSADMGAPSLDKFRTDFPAQFVNTGIAEQNAILVASGLAKEGKKVFVYAIASFLTLNCIEKIRVQNGMMNIPINIVGIGAGFSYPDSGPTHHLSEDIAIMRSIPNITTISVTDHHMSKKLAQSYKDFDHTHYIRLERQPIGELYKTCEAVNLDKGLHEIIEGQDHLIISNGNLLFKCKEILREKSLNFGLCDIFRYPLNINELEKVVKKYKKITTIEETFLPGGLGSSILEALSDLGIQMEVNRIGLDTKKGYCYQYGGREEIHKYYGIDKDSLISKLST
ncbi:MAG: 1-deoxy-D-xylulose-5-phosphate synthase [Bacteriovoracaceae bacterium]|jgi:transketolase|nr:1-deoxy-D-xylulose-5-phosphate synthase [Bacteriovoracaceae bacterium]